MWVLPVDLVPSSLEKFVTLSQVREVVIVIDIQKAKFTLKALLNSMGDYPGICRLSLIIFSFRYHRGPGRGPCFQCHVSAPHVTILPYIDTAPRPQEKEIIEHPYSCYVLGRSGTG